MMQCIISIYEQVCVCICVLACEGLAEPLYPRKISPGATDTNLDASHYRGEGGVKETKGMTCVLHGFAIKLEMQTLLPFCLSF